MPKLTEQVRFTDTAKLPDELAGFEGLALNERNELVGIDDEGDTKRISKLSEVIINFAKVSGAAEEVSPEVISPAAQAIIDRLEQQNQLLKDQLTASEQKNTDIEARLIRLEKRDQGVDGFNIGDAVAQLVDEDEVDEEYERGYEVTGFSDTNAEGIFIKNTETDEVTEVPSSNLVLEKELEDEEPEPEPTQLSWRDRARLAINNAAYKPFTRRTETVIEYDDQGREINRVDERKGGIAGYIGAGVVGAVVLFPVLDYFEHKLFGHSPTRDSRQIAHNHAVEMNLLNAHEHADKVRDAAELKTIKANHIAEMNRIDLDRNQVISAINHHEHMDFVRAAHAHKHDLSAINGVLKAVNRDHHTLLEHTGIYGTSTSGHSGDFSGYSTPWSYTHNESQLHTWASKAAAHGHKIRWIPTYSGKEMLEVDGTTNTQRVLQVVTQYK